MLRSLVGSEMCIRDSTNNKLVRCLDSCFANDNLGTTNQDAAATTYYTQYKNTYVGYGIQHRTFWDWKWHSFHLNPDPTVPSNPKSCHKTARICYGLMQHDRRHPGCTDRAVYRQADGIETWCQFDAHVYNWCLVKVAQ